MIFGDFAVEEAEGFVLAHTQRLGKQVLKKGKCLDRSDIAALIEAGVKTVSGAKIEDGDLDEDSASAAVAKALAGANVTLSKATTGRCNLIAACHGLLSLDADAINAANAIDEAITIATLPALSAVVPGDTVATIKVIPLAVAKASVSAVADRLAHAQALSLLPIKPARLGLVLTRVPGGRETLLDKAASVLRARLDDLGMTLAEEMRCSHEPRAVAAALAAMDKYGMDIMIVCGAAATVDRGDVVPAGIELAGGRIEHYGMPVEPGNLLVLAEIGQRPVIGMPGCARSPRLNGFDWVLQRLLAGVPVKASDLTGMGVGGLIVEKARTGTRSEKQMTAQNAGLVVTAPPRTAAIILAAGSSRRMGKANKLLAPYRGEPMIAQVVRAALASKADPVIVVTGHEQEQVRAALSAFDVQFTHAGEHDQGMSRSLQAGIAVLSADSAGAAIMLGDMPLVRPETVDRLIEEFDPWADASICIPCHEGKRGNPILLAREFFEEIMSLDGDTGARSIIQKYSEQIVDVAVDDPGVLRDFDTAQDLADDN
jgi:molybdenum cofactor cytidylyltransferase